MSADNFAHPHPQGPTGQFAYLGMVAAIQQDGPGEFNILVHNGTAREGSNFFMSLSEAKGDFDLMSSRFLAEGTPVYSQLPAPGKSERLCGYEAKFCNNRIFLTSAAAP